MITTTQEEPIRLDYHAKGRTVLVTPADNDRFLTSVEEAAMACMVGHRAIRFAEQYREILIPKLASWLTKNDKKVHKAFLSVREGGLFFLVVRQLVKCDSDFTNALTKLDIQIARDSALDLVRLDVLALPHVSDETASSFLEPGKTLEFNRA